MNTAGKYEARQNLKIIIIGAGALGCAMGARLAEAGHEIWLINRNQAHVDAIRERGLLVEENGTERAVHIHVATNCESIPGIPADLVVILVKSFHTREAIEAARPVLGSSTVVLSLQNGLGHEDILAEVAGAEKVIAGKTYAGGVLVRAGKIVSAVQDRPTIIGELDGRITERVKRIAEAFNDAGVQTRVSDNIKGEMWDKLLVNVSTGPLSAITRLPYGLLYKVPEVEQCAIAAVAEAMAVARALGVRLSIREPRDAWLFANQNMPLEFKASMLQSVEKGSITEIDFMSGAVVRFGRQVGIPTPVNETFVACVKGIEADLMAKNR